MLRKGFLNLLIQRNVSTVTYNQKPRPQTAPNLIEKLQLELKLKQLKEAQQKPLTATPETKKKVTKGKDEAKKAAANLAKYTTPRKIIERTELIRIRGPGKTAYLLEVNANDFKMMTEELEDAIKGSIFSFDNTVIEHFKMKGVLVTEPMANTAEKLTRAQVHRAVAGADEVREVKESNQLQFIVPLANTMKAKKILERLGYKILSSAYKFQPIERVTLTPEDHEICIAFVKELEKIPHIVSVIHNM